MSAAAHVLYVTTSHFCIPAIGVLGSTLIALLVKGARRSAHLSSVAAHVATLLILDIGRVFYLTEPGRCHIRVGMQNFLEISAGCWMHAICINIVLRFKNEYFNAKKVNFFMNLAYAMCIPLVIMMILEHHATGSWNENHTVYDTKTCFFDQGALQIDIPHDISLYVSLLRGTSLMITGMLFSCLSYKIGFQRRKAVLCKEDVNNIPAISARQQQAMNYILTMVATGVVEISADLGSWYFRYCQTELMEMKSIIRATSELPDRDPRFQIEEWLAKSLSFTVTFIRTLIVCGIVCCGGPPRRIHDGRVQTEDSLPPYEEAIRLTNPTTAMMLAPPPAYSSIFRDPNAQNHDELLLESVEAPAEESPMLTRSMQTISQDNEQSDRKKEDNSLSALFTIKEVSEET